MRAAILLLAALALAGCATHTTPITGQALSGPAAFGTLASFGTFEMELAPAYTRLAVLRHNAARALREKRIDVTDAEVLQAIADAARFLLDAAHAETRDGKARQSARDKLSQALERIQAGEQMLEGKP